MGPMVQARMVMVHPMQLLMLVGSIPGLAEVLDLALAEVSVEAKAEVSGGAVVAAEADLVSGGRFKLAFDRRKDGYYAKRRWNRTYRPGTWYRPRYGAKPGPG